MIKELGGEEDWEYMYEEPSPEENVKMNNTATHNCLMEERRALALKFEELTMEWVMNAQKSEKAAEISAKRDQIVEELAENYWELDPYIRARSLYDRQGLFCGVKGVQWYHKDEEDSLLAKLEKRMSAAAVSYRENASSGYESSVYEE